MSLNFYLIRKICECGCTEKFHLGQSTAGNEFLFHADTTWCPAMRYTMWTNRIIGWLETGGRIEAEWVTVFVFDASPGFQPTNEYGYPFSYPKLLERIQAESAETRRIEAEHDEAGRAWMIGEFF